MQSTTSDKVRSLLGKRLANSIAVSILLASASVTGLAADAKKPDAETPGYLDTSRSFEERAADLISRLTLEEKAALEKEFGPKGLRLLQDRKVMLGFALLEPDMTPKQRHAFEDARNRNRRMSLEEPELLAA